MVHINLDSTYSINADNLQWILLRDGRPYWFFQSLEEFLNAYLNLKLRGSDAKYSLIDVQNKQQERLYNLLTTLDFKTKLQILASGKGGEK